MPNDAIKNTKLYIYKLGRSSYVLVKEWLKALVNDGKFLRRLVHD